MVNRVHDMFVPQTRQYITYCRLTDLASNAVGVHAGGGHDVHEAFQFLDTTSQSEILLLIECSKRDVPDDVEQLGACHRKMRAEMVVDLVPGLEHFCLEDVRHQRHT